MAGGTSRLLEGLGLHLAPEREEVLRASPSRRQHARASPVPAATPLSSTVVTSAAGKMRMWASRGGKAQFREHQTVRGSSKGQRKRDARAWDGKREVRGGRSGGDTAGSEGSYISCFCTSHGAHCPECSLFHGCQQPLNSIRIGFPFRRHPPPKQRLAERVAVECDWAVLHDEIAVHRSSGGGGRQVVDVGGARTGFPGA